jgi:hypothetical protein
MQNEETRGAYEGGNSYRISGPISQGEKAMKVQLIALVFALTLCACTRTQTTLSGAAAGGVAGAAVAGPIGAAVGAGTGAFIGSR